MAQSITGGLFGMDVQDILSKRQAQQEAQALQLAQLDPLQQAQYGMTRVGQNLANIAAPLMGVEDPQLKAAGIAQQLAGQFDTSTAAGLKEYANALRQAGAEQGNSQLANFAMMALDKSRTLEASQVEQMYKTAQTRKELALADKALRELPGGVDTLVGKSTPESVAKFMQTGNIKDLFLTKVASLGEGRGGGGNISATEARYDLDKQAAIDLLATYGYQPTSKIKPSDAAKYPQLLQAQQTALRPSMAGRDIKRPKQGGTQGFGNARVVNPGE